MTYELIGSTFDFERFELHVGPELDVIWHQGEGACAHWSATHVTAHGCRTASVHDELKDVLRDLLHQPE